MALGGPGGAPPGAGAPAVGAPAVGAPVVGAPVVGAPAVGAPAVGGLCMYHHPPPAATTNAMRAMAVVLFDEDMGLRWLMTDGSLSTRLNHAHPLVCERVCTLVSRIS